MKPGIGNSEVSHDGSPAAVPRPTQFRLRYPIDRAKQARRALPTRMAFTVELKNFLIPGKVWSRISATAKDFVFRFTYLFLLPEANIGRFNFYFIVKFYFNFKITIVYFSSFCAFLFSNKHKSEYFKRVLQRNLFSFQQCIKFNEKFFRQASFFFEKKSIVIKKKL